jgi:hypothetical protein
MNEHKSRWPTEKMVLRDRMLETLSGAQEQRSTCQGTEWVVIEREAMYQAVNRERFARGKDPITMQEITSVETMASGHSDYSRKFALYCAELILDDPMKGTP